MGGRRRVGTLLNAAHHANYCVLAIVGKFLASWLFLALALALTFPVWITVMSWAVLTTA